MICKSAALNPSKSSSQLPSTRWVRAKNVHPATLHISKTASRAKMETCQVSPRQLAARQDRKPYNRIFLLHRIQAEIAAPKKTSAGEHEGEGSCQVLDNREGGEARPENSYRLHLARCRTRFYCFSPKASSTKT